MEPTAKKNTVSEFSYMLQRQVRSRMVECSPFHVPCISTGSCQVHNVVVLTASRGKNAPNRMLITLRFTQPTGVPIYLPIHSHSDLTHPSFVCVCVFACVCVLWRLGDRRAIVPRDSGATSPGLKMEKIHIGTVAVSEASCIHVLPHLCSLVRVYPRFIASSILFISSRSPNSRPYWLAKRMIEY